MKTRHTILMQIFIGFILIVLWFPAIIYFEYLNRVNNDRTAKLSYKIDDYYLKSGRMKKIGNKVHKVNTNVGQFTVNNSIVTTVFNYRKVKKRSRKYRRKRYEDEEEFSNYKYKYRRNYKPRNNYQIKKYRYQPSQNYSWRKYSTNTVRDNNFSFIYDNNKKRNIFLDRFKSSDFNSILEPTNIQKSNFNYLSKAFKVSDNKLVTIFAKNQNLIRVPHRKAKLFYPGVKTKQDILDDIYRSDKYFRWGMRLLTFLMLFGGLQLITSPLRWVIENSPQILNWPILNWFKWILVWLSQTLLFLWDAFSIFGALILTAVMTLIVFFLINYPITIGISMATYFIIVLVVLKKK